MSVNQQSELRQIFGKYVDNLVPIDPKAYLDASYQMLNPYAIKDQYDYIKHVIDTENTKVSESNADNIPEYNVTIEYGDKVRSEEYINGLLTSILFIYNSIDKLPMTDDEKSTVRRAMGLMNMPTLKNVTHGDIGTVTKLIFDMMRWSESNSDMVKTLSNNQSILSYVKLILRQMPPIPYTLNYIGTVKCNDPATFIRDKLGKKQFEEFMSDKAIMQYNPKIVLHKVGTPICMDTSTVVTDQLLLYNNTFYGWGGQYINSPEFKRVLEQKNLEPVDIINYYNDTHFMKDHEANILVGNQIALLIDKDPMLSALFKECKTKMEDTMLNTYVDYEKNYKSRTSN